MAYFRYLNAFPRHQGALYRALISPNICYNHMFCTPIEQYVYLLNPLACPTKDTSAYVRVKGSLLQELVAGSLTNCEDVPACTPLSAVLSKP